MATFTTEQLAAVTNVVDMASACFAIAYKAAIALDLPEEPATRFASQLLAHFLEPARNDAPDLGAWMARMTPGGRA